MLTEAQENELLKKELSYHTSRSGGKGGQNVNKVETKVEIEFDVQNSGILSERQKATILSKYKDFVDDSLIKISASTHRSQLENKQEARTKLIQLLRKLLKPVKKRLATKPSKSSKLKKQESKKHNSQKKLLRQKIK